MAMKKPLPLKTGSNYINTSGAFLKIRNVVYIVLEECRTISIL